MGGGFLALWPKGVLKAPWSLVVAVNEALQVISWHQLPRDERPPRHIWWSDKLLDQWFTNVYDSRNTKRRTSYEEAEDVPMTENELAAQFRQGRV